MELSMTKRNLLSGVLVLLVNWVLIVPASLGNPNATGLVSQSYTVENMTCAACPITVRKAMSRVEGVQVVNIDFDSKTVTAIYDPGIADVTTISEASASVGFPATAIGGPVDE
jgi:mercuric ion binding protein